MRAYAIVRKPAPGLQEHVIKLTKEEPKISIDGISENRLASPHKAGAPIAHELHSSGAYFKFSNEEGEKQSNRNSMPQEHRQSEKPVSQRVQLEPYPLAVVNQQPLPPKPARTKKLFQELPASPAKPREEEEPRYYKVHATPVRLLQPDGEGAVLPVESAIDPPHRKVRIFEHSQHSEVEVLQAGQRESIVYEAQSKSVFCCGEVSVESNKDHNQQEQQAPPQEVPQMFFSKPPPQSQTQARHQSSKKRRIFEEFEQKDRVVQQFTFKDQRLSSRNMEKEGEKSIRIKIFQFAPIPPFDI